MTIATSQVVRVAVTWNAPIATIAQNVFHYQNVGTAVAESSFLTAFDTYYTAALTPLLADIQTGYQPSTCEGWKYNMVTHKWEGIGQVNSTAGAGIVATDAASHGVAPVVRFVTAVARRQGRTFVPGFTEGAITGQLIGSSSLTRLGNYGTALVLGFTVSAQAQQMGTFNTDTASIYYESFSPVTGTVITSNVPGYQRRRKPGVGI